MADPAYSWKMLNNEQKTLQIKMIAEEIISRNQPSDALINGNNKRSRESDYEEVKVEVITWAKMIKHGVQGLLHWAKEADMFDMVPNQTLVISDHPEMLNLVRRGNFYEIEGSEQEIKIKLISSDGVTGGQDQPVRELAHKINQGEKLTFLVAQMGMGKSIMVVAAALLAGRPNKFVVLCSASAEASWSELSEYEAHGHIQLITDEDLLDIVTITGNPKHKSTWEEATVRIDKLQEILTGATLIVDEYTDIPSNHASIFGKILGMIWAHPEWNCVVICTSFKSPLDIGTDKSARIAKQKAMALFKIIGLLNSKNSNLSQDAALMIKALVNDDKEMKSVLEGYSLIRSIDDKLIFKEGHLTAILTPTVVHWLATYAEFKDVDFGIQRICSVPAPDAYVYRTQPLVPSESMMNIKKEIHQQMTTQEVGQARVDLAMSVYQILQDTEKYNDFKPLVTFIVNTLKEVILLIKYFADMPVYQAASSKNPDSYDPSIPTLFVMLKTQRISTRAQIIREFRNNINGVLITNLANGGITLSHPDRQSRMFLFPTVCNVETYNRASRIRRINCTKKSKVYLIMFKGEAELLTGLNTGEFTGDMTDDVYSGHEVGHEAVNYITYPIFPINNLNVHKPQLPCDINELTQQFLEKLNK